MKRAKFSLSHYKLLSARMGELVPIGLMEVLPGDTVQAATSMLLRTQPLLAPVMHPVHVKVHHWYVPHRLVWNDWENFITGGPDGLNASTFPTITFGGGSGVSIGSLADYMGIPPGINNIVASALPFRAYAAIWNEFYRDQDLQTALTIDLTDGADTTTNTTMQNGAWEKDYFTSARPWEQKGPAITVPLTGNAPVTGLSVADNYAAANTTVASTGSIAAADIASGAAPAWRLDTNGVVYLRGQTTGNPNTSTNRPQVFADLSNVSALTINALREALALQRFEEARARFGSRYVEYLRYLGVNSSDARLQRPEYLGGGKQTIQFSEVLQTAEGDDPVGEMRGHGIAAMRSNRYRRFFEEHGYVLTLMTVRPKTMYVQGLHRTWNRRVKEDFWQRELQHIGQQEVLNKEVYAAHASPDGVFGYQDRYDEYRRTESTIAGEFRDSTLDYWHMARIFSSDPALNADFVKCVPTERIWPSAINDTMYIMANHSVQARRLVARTGASFIY